MKVLKVVGYIFIGLVVFIIIMAGYGTVGLKQARALEIQSVDISKIEDGEYTGTYENGRWSNSVSVNVEDHKITEIKIIDSGNDSQIELIKQIADEVVSQQKVNVDTVSGATATTKSLLKAIENALAQ